MYFCCVVYDGNFDVLIKKIMNVLDLNEYDTESIFVYDAGMQNSQLEKLVKINKLKVIDNCEATDELSISRHALLNLPYAIYIDENSKIHRSKLMREIFAFMVKNGYR